MKLVIASSVLFTLPLFLAATRQSASPTSPPLPIGRAGNNILGNGGFEVWSQGNGTLAPLGPDLWFANGDTSATFSQNYIDFTRVARDSTCAGADWTAEITATVPGNYISQEVENFAEYAGHVVTFAVDFRTNFPVASPAIEIDDGTSVQSASVQVNRNEWKRLIVRKQISACPTKLEFKILPSQTVCVNNAMATVGRAAASEYVPRGNPEPALMEVPLGAVIDWYRFDVNMPVPEGYEIADGTVISDPQSPFQGLATIDLRNKFVRGASSVGSIGTAGGADSVSLSHTHSGTTSSNNGPGSPDYYFIASQCCDVAHVAKDGHSHSFTTNSALGTVSLVPEYVGLLKIMRIK